MTTSHTGCDERAACDCLYHHWRHHYPKRRHPGHVCGAASCRPCGCRHRRQAAGPPSSNPGLGRRLGDSAPSLSPRDQTSARYVIFGGSSKAGNWNLARGSLGLFAPGLVCDWRMALRRLVVSCHSRGVNEKKMRGSLARRPATGTTTRTFSDIAAQLLCTIVPASHLAIFPLNHCLNLHGISYLYLSIDLPQSGTKTIIGIGTNQKGARSRNAQPPTMPP